MKGMVELRRLALADLRSKHPTLPESAAIPRTYTDRTANGLTRAIIDFIRLRGGYATRINTTGQIRAGKWVKGTTSRGTADIMAVYQGFHLSIEVKIGRDRMSRHQLATRDNVEAAGGLYFIARDFQSFFDWITALDKTEGPGGMPEPSKPFPTRSKIQFYEQR
ncbi:MAG: hypothetical protein PHS48_09490 [Bacteroidales bacterium]|nr:hypothetical protein [Bacteroidales bacterium]